MIAARRPRCTGCGDLGHNWRTCSKNPFHGAHRSHERRIEGACLALSRFLVFVWMEAMATDQMDFVPTMLASRTDVLAVALLRGLLRMEWPR